MYAATWLLFMALPVVVRSVPQPPCEIPDGHTNGEFISGTWEPKGGRTCVVSDGFVETVTRRCEPRYCCHGGCTCDGKIYESNSECGGRTTVKLSCFVEHKDSKFTRTICCEGFEEDPNGICIGIGASEPSKTQPRSSTTQPLTSRFPRKQSSSSKALTTTPTAASTTDRPPFVVAGQVQRHGPEAKRSSTDHLIVLYTCLPLALLGILIGVLLFVYFRYRKRRKIQEAAVVFTTPGYDNTIYALPQPVHGTGRPSDGASLPPAYEESPYETIADFTDKKNGLPDNGDDDFPGAIGGSSDEKKVMSTREEPQVSLEAVPCGKPDSY